MTITAVDCFTREEVFFGIIGHIVVLGFAIMGALQALKILMQFVRYAGRK